MLKVCRMSRWRSHWASPSLMRRVARTGPGCSFENASGASCQTRRLASRLAPVDLRASRLDQYTRDISVHADSATEDANVLIPLIAAAITRFGKAHAQQRRRPEEAW